MYNELLNLQINVEIELCDILNLKSKQIMTPIANFKLIDISLPDCKLEVTPIKKKKVDVQINTVSLKRKTPWKKEII
jgi:hypothetical protein